MNELITPTKNEDGQQVVSARNLHKGLEASERFSSWAKRYITDDFIEGIDFSRVKFLTQQNQYGGTKEIEDFALTIETAKQVSMMQHTEIGKQVRMYYVKLEEKLIQHPALPTTPMEILETTFQVIKETDSKVDAVASRLDKFEDDQEIRNWEQEELLHLRRNKVFAVLGGRNSRQYKALSSDVFKAISKDFKSQFNVPRYNATPRKRFDDAKRFFMNWEPSDLLGFAIKGAEAD